MAASQPLPRTRDGLIQLQIFVDPWFGSETYIKFKAEAVVRAENQLYHFPLLPWRKFPTTVIELRHGRGAYRVDGYWAEQLQEAQKQSTPPPSSTP